ncbi:Serine-type D-Ala-D-Ala carboxypeptidase [uncultured Eubacteriales bacterium]|uniref:serine-type D-Ala-D-Ala carboxypeptidase n=1 Tax=uncultured Eubacteriales bacterium TaxID=172733 RepID=A0A212JYZ7_9FIRM|nr:Serine-type D-Ala-D-Ala carboxypeptidase [uncultured Eubacteriales bacterium]
MKRIVAAMLAALFLCSSIFVKAEGLSAPELSASCAILVDARTGRVLFEKNSNEKRAIASITKLMTALVAIRSMPDLSQEVTVKREYTLVGGSSMYLKMGEKVTLETLLYGLLMVSGNDAALAIADFCGGGVENFVGWMNDWAAELGMDNTHFANPSGLPDDTHYSTAADMAKLARAVMENEVLAKVVSTKTITIGGHSFSNHNKLLWQYEGCIGMKTGYTDAAGRTLVSCAERAGQRLIVVTLNAPNDWKDHAALLDYGFAAYPQQTLAVAGKEIRSLAVTGSLVRLVPVAAAENLSYPLAEGEKVSSKLILPESVHAPVRKGSLAGEAVFYVEGIEIGRTYLVYAASVANNEPKGRSLIELIRGLLNRPKEASFLAAFGTGTFSA